MPDKPSAPPCDTALRILGYIELYHDENGYPPSRRDIADALGTVVSVIQYHLECLRRQGLVTWRRNSPRTLRLC